MSILPRQIVVGTQRRGGGKNGGSIRLEILVKSRNHGFESLQTRQIQPPVSTPGRVLIDCPFSQFINRLASTFELFGRRPSGFGMMAEHLFQVWVLYIYISG